jgi:dynein heavy chain
MKDYLSLLQFISYFEDFMHSEVLTLSDKFLRIGETMLPQIAMAVFEKNDRKVNEMRPYYQYWERRIYNALIKMIIRALLEFKQLLSRPRNRVIPLFKV